MSRPSSHLPVVSRFAVVGLTATVLYVVLVYLLAALLRGIAGPASVSLLAYVLAASYSYSAHRLFTFMSNGAHKVQLPRFVVLSLAGAAISFFIPVIAENWLSLPNFISVAAVCVVIPVFNFFVLDRWVFGERNVGSV